MYTLAAVYIYSPVINSYVYSERCQTHDYVHTIFQREMRCYSYKNHSLTSRVIAYVHTIYTYTYIYIYAQESIYLSYKLHYKLKQKLQWMSLQCYCKMQMIVCSFGASCKIDCMFGSICSTGHKFCKLQ